MSLTPGDIEPSESRTADRALVSPAVTFNRLELSRILNLYGRMVADGEWRDYAIDFRKTVRCSRCFAERPKFRSTGSRRIRELARKQGMYSVISAGGMILRRGPRTRPCCWDRSQIAVV